MKNQPKYNMTNSTNFRMDTTAVASGVKDQNLFMDGATLSITGSSSIDDTLSVRNLTVTDTTTSTCDVEIGGDLSTENTDFHATTLSRGMDIISASEKSKTPFLANISDPQSPRDALTYAFYRRNSVQAYHSSVSYSDTYQFLSGAVKLYGGGAGTNDVNSTPRYSDYFTISEDRITPKKAGIYQVTVQCTRYQGKHSGNDNATFFLYLMSPTNKSLLSSTDTRGLSNTDRTTKVLHAIFPIPELTREGDFYIQVTSTADMQIKYFSTNVIWFPFNMSFSEVD
ncbi:hypothetical protein [Chlamydia pecorum]|uniref:hypothetical protein n=1 Tax=Chlamydia pecorum TaxID=85991 RepID=UPI0004268B41|nr:hypothetical protein [Chlamydia pecorum]